MFKVQIDYPDGAFAPAQTPRPVELIWGFVNPLNLSPYTTPTDKTITADVWQSGSCVGVGPPVCCQRVKVVLVTRRARLRLGHDRERVVVI